MGKSGKIYGIQIGVNFIEFYKSQWSCGISLANDISAVLLTCILVYCNNFSCRVIDFFFVWDYLVKVKDSLFARYLICVSFIMQNLMLGYCRFLQSVFFRKFLQLAGCNRYLLIICFLPSFRTISNRLIWLYQKLILTMFRSDVGICLQGDPPKMR